jgi:predicted Zn-dependent peptidase
MLFKGTRRRTARQIAEEIDYAGGQINAFTAKDCTCYYTKTLDSHIGLAADVLSDILLNSKLTKRDVNLERNVILEEINMYEDSPDELVHDLLTETIWRDCTLGGPILGSRESLALIDKSVMREYMSSRYVAPNIVISVAGSFDEKTLLADLEKRFKKVAGGAAPGSVEPGGAAPGSAEPGGEKSGGAALSSVEPGGVTPGSAKPGGEKSGGGYFDASDGAEYKPGICLRHKETEQIHLCAGFCGASLGSADIYPLQLINNIIGGSMSSVLFQKIREELGLVYSIYSYVTAYRNAGLFAIYAGMQPENAERVYSLIIDELKAFKRSGLSDDLLKRAKEQFKGSFYMGLENPSARMSAMGKSELLQFHVKTPDEIVEKIDAVTIDDAHRVMNEIIDFEKLAISAAGRIDGGLEAALTGRPS